MKTQNTCPCLGVVKHVFQERTGGSPEPISLCRRCHAEWKLAGKVIADWPKVQTRTARGVTAERDLFGVRP